MRFHDEPSTKEKKYASWHDVELQIKTIVDLLIVAQTLPRVIIAIGSGGIIPASLIAYHFGKKGERDIDLRVIYAQSYKGEERDQLRILWPAPGMTGQLKWMRNKVLIVDDIADSGATLEGFLKTFPDAQTAVLVHKQVSSVEPDFCGHVDNEGDRWWYVFPWENSSI